MNGRKLAAMGVSKDSMNEAIQVAQSIAKYNRTVEKPLRKDIEALIKECCAAPENFVNDTYLGVLAKSVIENRDFVPRDPIAYKTWGEDGIDQASHSQMKTACSVPVAVGGALMPDAHVGYGLPIGGVLATDNAVIPYAVGVDIACRMKMTVYDIRPDEYGRKHNLFKESLERGTVFGVGRSQEKRIDHAVMDQDWNVTKITREKKDTAWDQLGTSGSGNHFVEWGVLFLDKDDPELGLKSGQYMTLLSHSGSRGAGSAVCNVYSGIAQARLPKRYEEFGRLAWLDMDSEAGQEYWAAMNLMGDYAAANHDVIHRKIAHLIGEKAIAGIENHHNFCWLEEHDGRKVYVHRKGATPAGAGVLGVIPGSMADPAYVVRGKGDASSLCSASHGAGRAMSRMKAKEIYNFKAVKNDLAKKGIEILAAGADEVPGVYKSINEVMARQTDLVEVVARFDPRMVMMCGDNSKAED